VRTVTADTERLISQALAYARRGWPVFPCQPGAKEPATRHGFHDATTDQDQVRRWWQRQPMANLAIATGLPGPDVLDIDDRGPAGNGFASYRDLAAAGLLDRTSAIVTTPGGGLHLYFAGSTQACGRLAGHHLDFKARGGYVLAPPSVINGTPYQVIGSRAKPGGLDWPAAVRFLEPGPGRASEPDQPAPPGGSRLAAWVERQGEGNRNAGLFWAACRALQDDQPDLLDDLATAAAIAGLGTREITRTIASARRTHQRRQAGREAAR
jgi:hypothetical protein